MAERLEKLKELEEHLYAAMQVANANSIAAIAKQYRETIREIEEIEGGNIADDEIGDILAQREADGKSGAVRKDRSKL